ncbi:uncharacterized protein LOC144624792 [Crassostrea virginica]
MAAKIFPAIVIALVTLAQSVQGSTIYRHRRCAPVSFMCFSMSYDFATGCFVCGSSGNNNQQLTTTTMAPYTNTVKGQLKCKDTAVNCPHFMIRYDSDGCPFCSSGGPGSPSENNFLNHGAETNCLTFMEFMKCPDQCKYTDPIDGCNKCTCDPNVATKKPTASPKPSPKITLPPSIATPKITLPPSRSTAGITSTTTTTQATTTGCPPFPSNCPGPCGNFDPVTFCPICDYSICGMTPPPVSATTSSKCPAMFCVLNCPNGFKKDPNGCDRCECI